MKNFRVLLMTLPIVILMWACTTLTTLIGGSTDNDDGTPYSCSDTPKNAASTFLQGLKEFSFSLLKSVIPENASFWAIFGNNDEERGQEVVRQITAHPEIVGANRSCACSLYNITDTPDPQEKIVVIKRVSLVGDDLRDYKRAFLVHFAPRSNCITSVSIIDKKWERIH